MTDKERYERLAKMCREILDAEKPFYRNYDLPEIQKDYTIDFLLRAVLGLSEKEIYERQTDPLNYVENKFFAAYNKITNNKVYP